MNRKSAAFASLLGLGLGLAMLIHTGLPGYTADASSYAPAQATFGLSINDVSLVEGNQDSSLMVFTVTLTASGARPTAGVAYSTADGTPPSGASAPSDYTTVSNFLIFPSGTGTTTMTISVPINGDSLIEPDEIFFVNLGPADGATIIDGQGVGTIINDDQSCSYAIAPSSNSFEPDGGTGSVAVTAAEGCNWTAVSNAAWITITSGSAGAGNGTVTYSVAPNTEGVRETTITIADQSFRILQGSCILGFTPGTLTFPPQGGTGSVAVMAGENCDWTVVSDDPWVTITSGNSGAGNGTVRYTVPSYKGPVRLTRIRIGGVAHTVIQEGEADCTFSLTPPEITLPYDSSRNTILKLRVTGPEGCTWTRTSNDSWIDVDFEGQLFVGSQEIEYRVDKNPGLARTGTMTVAGQTFTVHQNSCPTTLSTTRKEFTYIAQAGSVEAFGDCTITVVSNADWITITSFNFGDVSFRIAENRGTLRTGTITIGDKTLEVAQFGVGVCAIIIDKVSDLLSPSGVDTGQVLVSAPPGCKWTPRSDSSWISVTASTEGGGDGFVQYTATPNTTGRDRFGTVEIKDESGLIQRTVSVTQRRPSPPCVEAISPQAVSFDDNSTTFSVQVTAPPDCNWEPISHAPWIESITRGGVGSGTAQYNVAINPGGQRSAIIDIGGRIHTVTQYVGECPIETVCQLFPAQCGPQMEQARTFRDKVLTRSERGRHYTQLYYKLSTEAVALLLLNPSLALRSRDILVKYKPLLDSMLQGQEITLSRGDLQEIESFLNAFAVKGSPDLKETVERLREDLNDPLLFTEFKITITDGPPRELPTQGIPETIKKTGVMILPLGLLLFCIYRARSRNDKARS